MNFYQLHDVEEDEAWRTTLHKNRDEDRLVGKPRRRRRIDFSELVSRVPSNVLDPLDALIKSEDDEALDRFEEGMEMLQEQEVVLATKGVGLPPRQNRQDADQTMAVRVRGVGFMEFERRA